MRSTVAIALALATVAVPAFSAPLPESSYTYDLCVTASDPFNLLTNANSRSVARTPLTERDLVELLGRAQAADGESGALGFGTLFKLGKGLVSSAEHILGGK